MTTDDLAGLLDTLKGLPSAQIHRHADLITVTATRKADRVIVKVLSAATTDGKQWHVMTQPELIKQEHTA
tara:strand:+ start:239 stop:448 length:210 start_codon:yes stop_codon:yes gene_type:complete